MKFMDGEFTSTMPGILIVTDKVEKYAKADWFNEHRVKLTTPVKFKLVQRALRKILGIEVPETPVPAKASSKPAATSSVGAPAGDTDVEFD